MDALQYCGMEASVRELFANLLASSMDARKSKSVHPSFVEILRQLAPAEARIISFLAANRMFPAISLYVVTPDGNKYPVLRYATHLKPTLFSDDAIDWKDVAAYVDFTTEYAFQLHKFVAQAQRSALRHSGSWTILV
jgi:hypothetical protein